MLIINKFYLMRFINNYIFFFLILFIVCCSEVKKVHISNTIMFSGKLYELNESEPFNGIVFNTYEEGEIAYEGLYKNGLPDGKLIYWFKNGMVKREGNLKQGVPVGRWTEYEIDGTLEKQVDY